MNIWVGISVDSTRYQDANLIPKNQVGLVLGTSKYTSDGQTNVFYQERILAAKRLYDAKKVDCLLLSGDNTTLDYNEPVSMQKSLLELGIPGERMYLDYAGVRTLDSILRAHDIFGLDRFTIVSQPFHVDRAIFIAESHGLSTIGYEAGEVGFWVAPKTYVREFFSRILLFYDIFIGTEPKF
jgi:SanA protein